MSAVQAPTPRDPWELPACFLLQDFAEGTAQHPPLTLSPSSVTLKHALLSCAACSGEKVPQLDGSGVKAQLFHSQSDLGQILSLSESYFYI